MQRSAVQWSEGAQGSLLYIESTCWQQGWPASPQVTHDGAVAPGARWQEVPLAPQ
jgi:hypothetical protein